jgi:hypothetical protein
LGFGSLILADAADSRFARLGFAISGDLKTTPKRIDNRQAPRRRCDISAWIRAEGCFATQPCRVLDLSQTGARLEVADAYRIPRRFVLLWSKNRTGIHANMKWRRSNQIGAEFLTASDLQQNYLTGRVAHNVAKLQELLRR